MVEYFCKPVILCSKKANTFFKMFIGILFITNNRSEQNYQTGIGLRFGGVTNGLTVKQFVSTASALEEILSVEYKNFVITGLFEKHMQPDHPNVYKHYYDDGRHIDFFQNDSNYYYNVYRLFSSFTGAGIDGVSGVEYTFKNAPVNSGQDFKPFIDFFNGSTVYFDGGLSQRYTL